jgi:hypothetical protein
VKPLFLSVAALLISGMSLGVHAESACGARVTVREVGRQLNDDGTRTLKYRASVEAETEASCAKISFSIMRSYVKADGSTTEGAIPMTIEARRRSTVIEGEDVLPTSRLVYWWADQVRCDACAGPAEAGAAMKPKSGSKPSGRRKVLGLF